MLKTNNQLLSTIRCVINVLVYVLVFLLQFEIKLNNTILFCIIHNTNKLQDKTNITYILWILLHNWQVFLFDLSRAVSTVTFCCTESISISGNWNYLTVLKHTGIISHIKRETGRLSVLTEN